MESAHTDSPASSFPRQFGKYHLLAPLAQGGMGALYVAVTGDRGLERLLVIKTVLPHLADKEYVARFRDEAKVVVQLSHQNLIPVFDAGQVGGELFLAMDLVEGKDLRAVWNRCAKKAVAFPLDVAAFVVKELCRGLGYAHAHGDLGVVHRDVSPPNVIVSYKGEVKLTDFGLAASSLKLEKTAPGIVYGKVSYMSPEQARGERLDGRSDLYAAGIILWELLTGRQLFPAGADQGQDLVDRSQSPIVPLASSRAPRVPPELDKICARALAPDRNERYHDGEAFREALATWLAAHHATTDAVRVERFLAQLFAEDIVAERAHRAELLVTTRERVQTLPPSHELHRLFSQVSGDDLDRRSAEGPNLGRRAVDDDDDARDRRRYSGRRAVDKIAEGVGTMLGLQASAPSPGGAAAAVAVQAEVLLTNPKTHREADSVIGTILDGRYRIDELIGEGGMGRVYMAEHVDIGRTVAVKILHTVYSNMPDLVERFRREARAASRIGHPNIVDVTDSGITQDGSAYFVMEYLDGVELGSVIDKEGALEVGRALGIATQICRALAAAHAVDIIHRDLKPENVFLITKQGSSDAVKVLDFGIAKTGEAEKTRERRLTSPGVAMGTPEYMAPEQAAGRPSDERCDIYAVGAILYEMLSGIPPYEGENFMEILSKKATSEPAPLETFRPGIPSEVVEIVSYAMARDPAQRPPSMEAFEYELTKLSSGRAAAVANAIGLASEHSGGALVRTNPPIAARSNPPAPRSNPSPSPLLGELNSLATTEEAPETTSPPPDSAALAEPRDESRRASAVVPVPFETAPTEAVSFGASRAQTLGWWAFLLALALFASALIYVLVGEAGDNGSGEAGMRGRGAANPAAVDDASAAGDRAHPKNKDDKAMSAKSTSNDTAIDKDKADKDKADRDKAVKEKADKDKADKDKADKDKADKDKDKTPNADKGDAQAALSAGDAALASSRWTDAISSYNEALAGGLVRKGNLGLGRVAFNRGKWDEAIKYGLAAGGSASALQLVGDAYWKKGDCANAKTYYGRWASKDPGSKGAQKALSRCP